MSKELTVQDCSELIEYLDEQQKQFGISIKEEKYRKALIIARRELQSVDTTTQQYESLVRKNV